MIFRNHVLALYRLALGLNTVVGPLETVLVVQIQCRAVAVALAGFQLAATPMAEIQYLVGKANSACRDAMAGRWGQKEKVSW